MQLLRLAVFPPCSPGPARRRARDTRAVLGRGASGEDPRPPASGHGGRVCVSLSLRIHRDVSSWNAWGAHLGPPTSGRPRRHSPMDPAVRLAAGAPSASASWALGRRVTTLGSWRRRGAPGPHIEVLWGEEGESLRFCLFEGPGWGA